MQEPFSETFRVLERHKIRLTKDVYSRIPFFAKKTPETVKAVAVPGRYGGIQIIFEDASLTNLLRRIETHVQNGQATEQTAVKNWTLLARYLSNVWTLTFSFHDGRYTMVLPRVARDLGLVSKNEGEDVLVFVCGQIFEIWRPDAWVALTTNTGLKIDQLRDDLPDSDAENPK